MKQVQQVFWNNQITQAEHEIALCNQAIDWYGNNMKEAKTDQARREAKLWVSHYKDLMRAYRTHVERIRELMGDFPVEIKVAGQAGKKTLVLIGCSKKKKNLAQGFAYEIYDSALFKASFNYALYVLGADLVLVLSAKYGAISPYKMIEPYDLNLRGMGERERFKWGKMVAKQIKNRPEIDTFDEYEWVSLAGAKYTQPIQGFLDENNIVLGKPLAGMGIGVRQAFMKRALDDTTP